MINSYGGVEKFYKKFFISIYAHMDLHLMEIT